MTNSAKRLIRLIALLSVAFAPALQGQPDRQIESLIDAGKFAEARPVIEQRLEQSPDDAYLQYNLALTHYAEGNYEDAVVLWEKVRLTSDKKLVTKAMAQIGNASYRISTQIGAEGRKEDETIQLRRALHSLQAAIERDADYEIAQKNHDYVADKIVDHLVEQGNSKIERSEVHWIKGSRDLVLFRSALTDYEEALSIKPEDEEIQKLVEETRKKMTDFLKESGEKNLQAAEKKIDQVSEPTAGDQIKRDEGRELQRAEDEITEAVANFEDAMSISPDDEATKKEADEAREKASELMQEIADKWRKNSEVYDDILQEKQAKRDDLEKQLENESDKQEANKLRREMSNLSREMHRDRQNVRQNEEKALEDYERALDYNPENQEALAAMDKLKEKMSEDLEAEADTDLENVAKSESYVERNLEQMADYQEQLQDASEQKASQIESRMDDLERSNAANAQRAADELLQAKAKLEEATYLDPENTSAEQKLEATNERLADVLEQAGDMQMQVAEQHLEAGKPDQAIASMEQAIKDFDTAATLSQDPEGQQAMSMKMEAAQQELLAQRNERAQELAAQQQAQQQMAAQNQPPQPSEQGNQPPPEEAVEYTEMVQFAEDSGGEQFGKFDTKAMKSVVKDW